LLSTASEAVLRDSHKRRDRIEGPRKNEEMLLSNHLPA
jgi:hypothetical protein